MKDIEIASNFFSNKNNVWINILLNISLGVFVQICLTYRYIRIAGS